MSVRRVDRPRRLTAAIAASVLLLVGVGAPAHAAGLCASDGPALHVFDPDDHESGAGGTGRAPIPPPPERARPGDDEESGIGGTGIRPHAGGDDFESGSGGTGLLGTIRVLDGARGEGRQARGDRGTRLCLNGVAVDVPQTLALESGGPDGSAALQSGRVAFVEAIAIDGRLVATRVVLAGDRMGRIDVAYARDPAGGDARGRTWVLRVSGVEVRVDPETMRGPDLRAFEAGTWVRYQGHVAPDGVLHATRVDRGEAGRIVRETRPLGDIVLATLRDPARRRLDYLSLEGFVGGPATRPDLARVRIELPERPPRALHEATRPGRKVRIGGRPTADGAVRPAPAPRWLAPPRPDARPGAGRRSRPVPAPDHAAPTPRDDAPGIKTPPRPPRTMPPDAAKEPPPPRVDRPPQRPEPPPRPQPTRPSVVRPTDTRIDRLPR